MDFICFFAVVTSNFLIYADGSEYLKQEPAISKTFKQDGKASFILTLSDLQENAKCSVESSNNIKKDETPSFIVTLLNNAKNIIEDAKKFAATQISCSDSISCEKPMDCSEIKKGNPNSKSGVFKIWPCSRISSGSISVYCDMEDDNGGWTVIQRRGDFDSGEQYFYQNWAAYKNGFGNLKKDFWLEQKCKITHLDPDPADGNGRLHFTSTYVLDVINKADNLPRCQVGSDIGNDNIFAITNQGLNTAKFTLSDWEGNKTYATYDEFWIDDDVHKYTLHVQGYRGTAGNSFSDKNGAPFSTKDQDNDSFEKNCAVEFKGAWWYKACHSSNLNGAYLKGVHESFADGVNWKLFRGYNYSLKDTVIKIRPKDFTNTIADITPH